MQKVINIEELARSDGRYTPEAFRLVSEALSYTTEMVKKGKLAENDSFTGERKVEGTDRVHVSGQELLEGFRQYIRKQYGNMALLLLERSGLRRSEDVGEVVFIMVNAGLMGKRENDSLADFKNGYDFREAFDPAAFMEE